MKSATTKFLEQHRLKNGSYGSDRSFGFNGVFFLPMESGLVFKVICSDGMGWEHVSVSLPDRCPTWDEMCWIKNQFWDGHETIMQLHPPESEYVNNARFCLHLWKPTTRMIPLPPSILVGIKSLGAIA